MRRRAGTGHNAASKLARNGAKPRRAPKAEHGSAPSALELQEQVGALTRGLIEAREQQAATADVPLSYGLYASPLPGAGAAYYPAGLTPSGVNASRAQCA